MLRRNRRPLFFTERQLRQLERTTGYLHKSNRAALRELQRLGYLGLTTTRYSKVGNSLQLVGAQMISALRLRQDILRAASDREPPTFRIVVVEKCKMCSQNGQRGRPDDDEPASGKALKQDPAYQEEIESLLELAQRTAERVSRCCNSRGAPTRTLFAGISRLTSTLLRQKRHLRETAFKSAQAPRIEVHYGPECTHCHKPGEKETGEECDSRTTEMAH